MDLSDTRVLQKTDSIIAVNTHIPLLIDSQHIVHHALLTLLRDARINHDYTFDSICRVTQKKWLRKPGCERWHLKNQPDINLRNTIITACQKLGMFDSIYPLYNNYQYILILGTTLECVIKKWIFFLELIHQGYQFENVIILGSDRKLDKLIENESVYNELLVSKYFVNSRIAHLGLTEMDMMHAVIELTRPQLLSSLSISYINTPLQSDTKGILRRPNTADTFITWLSTVPLSGTVCILSMQPDVGYQDMVARTHIPQTFTIHTAGPSCKPDDVTDAELLDTIARWIYQTQKYYQSF